MSSIKPPRRGSFRSGVMGRKSLEAGYQMEKVKSSSVCIYRGEQTGTAICTLCGQKGKEIPVYICAKHNQACTPTKHRANQNELLCLTCDDFTTQLAEATQITPEHQQ